MIKTKEVPLDFFIEKVNDLERQLRLEILLFIFVENEGKISRFEYGRIPEHRVYAVFFNDGTQKAWVVEKLPPIE